MSNLRLEIITPDGIKFEDSVYEVILPTPMGQIGLLPNHEPLIALASPGVVFVRHQANDPDSKLEHFATGGGLIEVNNNSVHILADTAEHSNAIDDQRAREALEKAREMQKNAQDHVALADASALIERNLARIKTVELKKRHHL
jgi:F-type H+-transporting ATPase subunit epsilon